MSVAKEPASGVLYDFAGLQEQVAVLATREEEMLASPWAASGQKVTATAELRQAQDTIVTQIKKLARKK